MHERNGVGKETNFESDEVTLRLLWGTLDKIKRGGWIKISRRNKRHLWSDVRYFFIYTYLHLCCHLSVKLQLFCEKKTGCLFEIKNQNKNKGEISSIFRTYTMLNILFTHQNLLPPPPHPPWPSFALPSDGNSSLVPPPFSLQNETIFIWIEANGLQRLRLSSNWYGYRIASASMSKDLTTKSFLPEALQLSAAVASSWTRTITVPRSIFCLIFDLDNKALTDALNILWKLLNYQLLDFWRKKFLKNYLLSVVDPIKHDYWGKVWLFQIRTNRTRQKQV